MKGMVVVSASRSRVVGFGLGRLVQLGALVAAVVGVAGCPAPDGTGSGDPIISLTAEGNRTSLTADGVSTLTFTVRAFAADASFDDSSVDVTVTAGTLSAPGATPVANGRQLALTPVQGTATFSYMCEPFVDSPSVVIAVDNGNDDATVTIACNSPQGSVTADVETGACTSPTDPLRATGNSNCEITGSVVLAFGNTPLPQPGANLRIEVASVSNITLPNGEEGDPETDGDEAILSAAPGGTLRKVLDLPADDQGNFSFFLNSITLNKTQTVTLRITGNAQGDLQIQENTFTIAIQPFDNRSTLDLSVSANQVIGGAPVTLTVTADDERGLPAGTSAGRVDQVILSVPSGTGATFEGGAGADGGPQAGESVTLDFVDGTASVDLLMPNLDVNEGPRTVVVTALYTPIPGLPSLSDTVQITANPEGALLVNAVLSAPSILSDENETVTLTVTQEKNASTTTFPVQFTVRPADVERIGFGTRSPDTPPGATPLPVAYTGTPASPQAPPASVVVSSQNPRVRGVTTIQIQVVDTDENPNVTYDLEVDLDVDRAPILQSLVFVSVTPTTIGVVGSPYPSSTQVAFKAFDDLNQPMANVPVFFDTPDTADPDASVVGSDLTGPDGTASTVLSAGTRAVPISVVATAISGNTTLVVESVPIPVTGGLPSFSNSYLVVDADRSMGAYPLEVPVTTVLADRFTNQTPTLNTQYRAEGGNIEAIGMSGSGATFVSGAPGPSSADVLEWSYGLVVPDGTEAWDLGGTWSPAGCVDAASATGCDLLTMCIEENNDYWCPLPRLPDGRGCWEDINPAALAFLGVETPTCNVVDDVNGRTVDCPTLGINKVFPNGYVTGFDYSTDAQVRGVVEAYKDDLHRCGFAATCLLGQNGGFVFTDSDNCRTAPGCFDFNPLTPCPQSSLITIVSSVRGEESFTDANGNGVFDYDDQNGNGVHDPGEPSEDWIDLPESFLDKNDNCSFDTFEDSIRMETSEQIRHSDLFSDEDNSGDFGYATPGAPNAPRTLANGKYDRDKEIFFQTHALGLAGLTLIRGTPCSGAQVGQAITCPDGSTATCIERSVNPGPGPISTPGGSVPVGAAFGVADCAPAQLVDPELSAAGGFPGVPTSATIYFTWTDPNGVCFNDGWSDTYTVAAAGALEADAVDGDVANLCGFGISRSGGGLQNARRPWCDEFPYLGAQLASVTVQAACNGEVGVQDGTLSFTHSYQNTTIPLSINVQCGRCGDGFVVGDEECDDGNNTPGDGCSPACVTE